MPLTATVTGTTMVITTRSVIDFRFARARARPPPGSAPFAPAPLDEPRACARAREGGRAGRRLGPASELLGGRAAQVVLVGHGTTRATYVIVGITFLADRTRRQAPVARVAP